MLHEIKRVVQYSSQRKRRWFFDPEGFDLLIWIDEEEKPVEFQLSIDKKVFGYIEDKLTYTVTDNAGRGYWWMSEILLTPSQKDELTKKDKEALLRKFRNDAVDIDPVVGEFVLEQLSHYFTRE